MLLKSGCKGMTFSRISKTFEEKSWIFVIVLTFICKIRRFPWAYTLYYIRAGVRCDGGANICRCSRRPHPRKGCTLPHPASLRNFYTCTRRHRGEMSLTERDAGAALWHYRRLGSATMTGNLKKKYGVCQRAVEPNAGHGMAASPIGAQTGNGCRALS